MTLPRQETVDILLAMERLADGGEIRISDEDKNGFDQRYNYQMFRRDYFVTTQTHWERKSQSPM